MVRNFPNLCLASLSDKLDRHDISVSAATRRMSSLLPWKNNHVVTLLPVRRCSALLGGSELQRVDYAQNLHSEQVNIIISHQVLQPTSVKLRPVLAGYVILGSMILIKYSSKTSNME